MESVSHLLYEKRKFPPLDRISRNAHIKSFERYLELYRHSIENPSSFWLKQAETLAWMRKPTQACNYVWNSKARNIQHRWFEDGKINVSVNCLDRHLSTDVRKKIAILWQGDEEKDTRKITYEELFEEVCRFANVLKSKGIKKGDRVCIYLPMIPEAVVALLACARIGAIHSVVFGGFSAEALGHRIQDAGCKLLITSNVSLRGGKIIPLKEISDQAIEKLNVETVIVVKRTDAPVPMKARRDHWYHEVMSASSIHCEPEILDANDPLFILYTSGSTGKPKGVVHGQSGYLLHAALTHKYVFDLQDSDIYWCTADVGWVTGHSYVVYGPLANGATTLLFEGVPTYPDPGRIWQIVDKFHVSILYTAPTLIRSLIHYGDAYPAQHCLSSLRVLGTVGEPINPEAWMWYYEVVGKGNCPVVDTWWQTETGGILITPLPGSHTLKPGSATRPFFGVDPVILRDDGTQCEKNEGGSLCIKRPWPGIMLTTWGEHDRFIDTYFSTFANHYFSGDGAYVDEDGDFWLLGRIDDVVNVSGHRIGTAEVESALVGHDGVAEAAVVPIPHEVKGQGLCAYVTLVEGVKESEDLREELKKLIRNLIGPFAAPERIQFAKALPKTRSGKIMRRVLRKIAEKKMEDLGDISTLADPKILEDLL